MRILFIGDIVGRSGRTVLLQRLPGLIRDWKLDFVAINGENAAGGFGITEAIYQEFVDAADVVTGGNHSWDQKRRWFHRAGAEAHPSDQFSGGNARPRRRADRGEERRARAGRNAMGRIFMDPLDDPSPRSSASSPVRSRTAPTPSSSTSRRGDERKQAMGHFATAASLVIGTHTHAPTADHQILPSAPLHVRRRHDRRLQLRDRDDKDER
jgi:calcineurin-like phosphoesterase